MDMRKELKNRICSAGLKKATLNFANISATEDRISLKFQTCSCQSSGPPKKFKDLGKR